MSEKQMTLSEMEAAHSGEWILIGEPKTGEALEVTSGRVLWHSRDRDEVYRQALAQRPKRSAIIFTGEMPENTAVVLCRFHSSPVAA